MRKKLITLTALIMFVMVLITFPTVLFANGYVFPSTNELNQNQQTPGYVGKLTPHVNLIEAGIGYVDLEFVGGYVGGAFFELRIDGEVKTSGTPHPVTGDFIYPGVWVIANTVVQQRVFANERVEVRLALGGGT